MVSTLRRSLQVRARARARQRFWDEYDRETYCCPCGRSDGIEVHHRDGDWLNNELLNLVGLCHRCHRAVHRRQTTREHLDEWRDSVADLGGDVNRMSVGESSDGAVGLATDGGGARGE